MSAHDDVIQIINRTALIENILNQVIEKYCCPRKEAFPFFWTVLLDGSIMPLGAKVKIAMAISQAIDAKLDQDSLHKLISFRNAFAHHGADAHPTLFVGKNPEEDELHYMLHVVTHSGKIQQKRRGEALAEFNACYEKAKKSLMDLLGSVITEVQGKKSAAQ